jgi:hypothetical protein
MEVVAMLFRTMRVLLALLLVLAAPFLASEVRSDDPKADSVKELQPPLVTIQGKDLPLSKALKLFADKTSIGVLAPPGDDPTLKLDLANVPFWKALDEIAKAADMRVYPYVNEGKLALRQGYRELPTSYHGPFRVTLKRVVTAVDLESDAHLAAANIEVAWLPSFQAFLLETHPSSLVVQDDKGSDLKVPPRSRGPATVFGRNAVELDSVPLPAVRRSVPQFGLIKGTLSMIGSAKQLTFAFDAIEKNKELKQDGVIVKLSDVDAKKGEDTWQVQFHLRYPKDGPQFESFQMQSWLAGNRLFLVNKKTKQRVRIRTFNTDAAPADEAIITYIINEGEDDKLKLDDPKAWSLEYQTPSPVMKVSIPFEFKDVPLP